MPFMSMPMMASSDDSTIAASRRAAASASSLRRMRSASARLRSEMSRAIFDTPTIVPSAARIGETVRNTSMRTPSFRTRTLS